MTEPTAQEILAQQGTRLSSKAPWETYDAEMDVRMNPRLAEEVAAYEQTRIEETNSSEAKEELHRQKELNEQVAKEYQWLHPSEYVEEGPRVGRVLHSDEFISKLRRKGVRCWYIEHPQPRKLTLLYYRDGMEKPEVACWVQAGHMPEYSFMNFDEHGVPLAEKRRGWRTCLLQMVLKGIISEARAVQAFGVAHGPASERYNRTLCEWRKTRFDY